MTSELLPDSHTWFRIADPAWGDPVDPSFAEATGGRWNPPGSFPTLYLSEDIVTARHNLRLFLAGLPYGPEDLADANGPNLVAATIPRNQTVLDVHTPAGVADAGLPKSYPRDEAGRLIPHSACQPVGLAAKNNGLRGVRSRAAQTAYGAGRDLAWFPATARSRAKVIDREPFAKWFWG